MADELDVLLEKVDDAALRADLHTAIQRVKAKRSFGLVFESHLPERVRLPDHPIRRGVRVVHRDADDEPRLVSRVKDGSATLIATDGPTEDVDISELVVVAEFGQAIYPGLTRLGSIDRGSGNPAHVVINAENHHALEALQFTHAGRVDCIYIDPPYNTGARDWKYDNNYVDADDGYRHSKWLAFMERRLRLAKQLLNPDDSVLVVTIDEKEFPRLGMLLEQIFQGAKIQMVSVVINAPGQARKQELARVNEFAYFVFIGRAEPVPTVDDLLNEKPSGNPSKVRWESLLRSGTNSRRKDSPALFYPVFISREDGRICGSGQSKPVTAARSSWMIPPGVVAIWPLKNDGSEGRWRASPDYLRELVANGHARVGQYGEDGRGTIWYLGKSVLRRIDSDEVRVVGTDEQGAVVVEPADDAEPRRTVAKTVWNRPAHHSGWHGSALLRALLPDREFPFPKSLYAVEDALRICVGNRPDAVVLDFFAGSGTTSHAVMRLNKQDGGQRQSILVTNNEVSAEEAHLLRSAGHRQGDSLWEERGIFEHITRPRVEAAITGFTPAGESITGSYKFIDEFPMSEGFEENVEFFKLTYLDPVAVELDRAFVSVAPLLWMRSGGVGPMLDQRLDAAGQPKPYAFTAQYGVLFNPDRWRAFVHRLPASAGTVFIVTDSPSTFAGIAAALPEQVEAVRLYENYLTTFVINRGR